MGTRADIEWRNSKAHLLLLSKHLKGTPLIPAGYLRDTWEDALGEDIESAINGFVRSGLLENSDLDSLLNIKYDLKELKVILKSKKLPVSGKKHELISRLIAFDKRGAEELVAGFVELRCSDEGAKIVEDFLQSEQTARENAEQQTIKCLQGGRYADASLAVAAFEADQVFWRGIGIDWAHQDPTRNANILAYIFSSRPRILSGLNDSDLDHFRLAAGMALLWSPYDMEKCLPPGFIQSSRFSIDRVVGNLIRYALNCDTLDHYRKMGFLKDKRKVKVMVRDTSCECCKAMAECSYTLDNVPELPNENCTDELGCRCRFSPDYS